MNWINEPKNTGGVSPLDACYCLDTRECSSYCYDRDWCPVAYCDDRDCRSYLCIVYVG